MKQEQDGKNLNSIEDKESGSLVDSKKDSVEPFDFANISIVSPPLVVVSGIDIMYHLDHVLEYLSSNYENNPSADYLKNAIDNFVQYEIMDDKDLSIERLERKVIGNIDLNSVKTKEFMSQMEHNINTKRTDPHLSARVFMVINKRLIEDYKTNYIKYINSGGILSTSISPQTCEYISTMSDIEICSVYTDLRLDEADIQKTRDLLVFLFNIYIARLLEEADIIELPLNLKEHLRRDKLLVILQYRNIRYGSTYFDLFISYSDALLEYMPIISELTKALFIGVIGSLIANSIVNPDPHVSIFKSTKEAKKELDKIETLLEKYNKKIAEDDRSPKIELKPIEIKEVNIQTIIRTIYSGKTPPGTKSTLIIKSDDVEMKLIVEQPE